MGPERKVFVDLQAGADTGFSKGGGGGGGFETRHMKSGGGGNGGCSAVRLRPRWVSSYLYISRR